MCVCVKKGEEELGGKVVWDMYREIKKIAPHRQIGERVKANVFCMCLHLVLSHTCIKSGCIAAAVAVTAETLMRILT